MSCLVNGSRVRSRLDQKLPINIQLTALFSLTTRRRCGEKVAVQQHFVCVFRLCNEVQLRICNVVFLVMFCVVNR